MLTRDRQTSADTPRAALALPSRCPRAESRRTSMERHSRGTRFVKVTNNRPLIGRKIVTHEVEDRALSAQGPFVVGRRNILSTFERCGTNCALPSARLVCVREVHLSINPPTIVEILKSLDSARVPPVSTAFERKMACSPSFRGASAAVPSAQNLAVQYDCQLRSLDRLDPSWMFRS